MNLVNLVKNGGWKAPLTGFGMKMVAAKPEIALIVGGISLLAGTIYACVKTEKAKKSIEEAKEEIKKVDEAIPMPKEEAGVDILPATIKQIKIERGRQYTKIYGKLALNMLKVYGIPALLWTGGMGLVVGAHVDLRHTNKQLAADVFAGTQLMREYRERVARAVGEETERKIYMGAHEGTVQVLETDPITGEKKLVEKTGDIFDGQTGSIFARNYTVETTDIMYKDFTREYAEKRANMINNDLETGLVRGYTGLEIFRKMGFNENALGLSDEEIKKLREWGISGNARKVPDPEMRKLKLTFLRGFRKMWDVARNCEYYEPCLRLDFNFYPLDGKI